MMSNAEGIDQSSSIFDVKKIDAKKMISDTNAVKHQIYLS